MNALVSARSTAAIARSEVIGSLILMGRAGDPSNPDVNPDTNLHLAGGPTVSAPRGVVLGSTGSQAGFIDGSGEVQSPFTYVRDPGSVDEGGGSWTPWTREPGGAMFSDPMRGKGQPPINASQQTLPYIAVPGGNLNIGHCPGGVCAPGNYFATEIRQINGSNVTVASGRPIRVEGLDVNFAGGTFGDFVFFGGLLIGDATVDFGPGRYVMAGAFDNQTPVFQTTDATLVTGGTSPTSSAGRLFILTDSSYGGRLDPVVANFPMTRGWTRLQFGPAELRSGVDDSSGFSAFGLNPSDTNLPAELESFGPLLIWQDQRNSPIRYTPAGQIDISCAGATLENPCSNTIDDTDAPKLELYAGERTTYAGVIYQPRGAWTTIQATSDYDAPLRIITGSMRIQGSQTVTLSSTPAMPPLTRLTSVLVE
jgi:hypothetical protein